ncbi:abhydrolase domain-containing protein 11 [Luminiphilus syltensis NOR5-1B]|uniref:Abhydrolase domain-containing protein 11 n=1 Tax=Luminiphilus syltensis NOR5-1B TaxID=565045 RepID=B8KXT3_9GAMM|nr:alpha/beta fold hydrolase [Luminiphilus syltensis]EED35398.1 abhydrolase domain-containing protein 11 [Luminiphilus syltensis NOR5-1B]
MNTTLHDSVLGNGPDVVLLHGLFGQGSNLGGIARGLQGEFKVHSLDLPDHGHSFWSDPPSIAGYAKAVADWMEQRELPVASFVGHSLGGKVAMQLALTQPVLVDRLVVADIAPVAYPRGHDGVFAGMAEVARNPAASRREAGDLLSKFISEDAVVQFLLLHLMRADDGRYVWRLNREGLEAAYDGLREGLDSDLPFDGETLFLRGGDSDYVLESYAPHMDKLFSHYRVETLEGTGHWLHAEKPAEFNAAVLDFLL